MALADTAHLVVQLRLDDQFSGQLKRAQGALGGFTSSQIGSVKQIGRGVGQVATGFDRLATRATLAAVGGLGLVVKTAIDFEDAWAGVEKTVNETDLTKAGLSFQKLQDQFRAMAREIPVSFEELSNIGAQAGALGIAAADLTDFTEVVAKLGVTTNLSSDEAATALGQLGTTLHLTGHDFDDFADSLVNLGNQGASTEAQIIHIATRFAAAGHQAGLSKEEILGFASATASFGIQEEAAGSALSRIFNQTTLNIGTASKKAKEFAGVLGLSFTEFKRSWDRDASGTFQDFLAQLGKLGKFEQASVLKAIGITNVRDVNAIQLMAQNTQELTRQLNVARDASGALNKEAEKRFGTTRNQIVRFGNILRDTGFVIGQELLPVINDALADLTRELAKPANQEAIRNFATNLANGARELVAAVKRGDFNSLLETMKGAAAIAKGAFDAFNALPGPVKQLALAAIVANKVSGGAIGSIAKGLANIFAGTLKLAFPKFDIFSRGSPANPMWVKAIGGLPGGGGGGGSPLGGAPAAGAGASGLSAIGAPGFATLLAGIAAPIIAFDLIPLLVNAPKARPGSLESNTNTGVIIKGTDGKDLHVSLPPSTTASLIGIMPSFSRFAAEVGTVADNVNRVDKSVQGVEVETRQAKTVFSQRLAGIRIENIRQRQAAQATKLATDRGFAKTAALERDIAGSSRITSRKDFNPSFHATLNTTVNAQLSTYSAVQQITRVSAIDVNGKAARLTNAILNG